MDFKHGKWNIRCAGQTPEVDEIVQLATDLEAAEARGDLKLVKPPSDFRRVVSDRLSSGREVFIKFYIPYGTWRTIKDRLRRGYSKAAYDLGTKLIQRGILTPQPIAYGWKTSGFRIERSFTATERIAGAVDLGKKAAMALKSNNRLQQEDFVKALAGKLYETHEKRFYHPDLKDFHVLVRDKGNDFELIFIDLDRCRLMLFMPDIYRRRNLYQIRYYVLGGWPADLRTLFLEQYCKLWKQDSNQAKVEVEKALKEEFKRLHDKELTLIKQEKRALTLQARLLKKFPMPEDIEDRIDHRRERKIERRREFGLWKAKVKAPKKQK